jgi:transposase
VLSLAASPRVHLATEPVNFHHGHAGLCGIVRNQLDGEPLADVWVFFNRSRTDLKILWFDHGGFVVAHKKLAQGRFRVPPATGPQVSMTSAELAALLEGIDLTQARRLPRWNPPRT